jgi:hypothetical protein
MPKCPVALEGDKEMVEWENWARNQLMAAGSDLLGKFSNLQVTTKNHQGTNLSRFGFAISKCVVYK